MLGNGKTAEIPCALEREILSFSAQCWAVIVSIGFRLRKCQNLASTEKLSPGLVDANSSLVFSPVRAGQRDGDILSDKSVSLSLSFFWDNFFSRNLKSRNEIQKDSLAYLISV